MVVGEAGAQAEERMGKDRWVTTTGSWEVKVASEIQRVDTVAASQKEEDETEEEGEGEGEVMGSGSVTLGEGGSVLAEVDICC